MLAERAFFIVYRLVLWPTFRVALGILSLFNEKIKEGLAMRAPDQSGRPPWLAGPQGSRPIWIHCASGEFEYAKPVITRLKKLKPSLPVLVTYFSPSIAKGAKGFPGVDLACPLPWETPTALKEFISWHEPRALLIARTDTWPEMLRQTRRAGVPSLLFSATLPAHSGRAKGLGRWLSRVVFSFLSEIFCVSPEDEKVFLNLKTDLHVRIGGDTRYDQVQARLQAPKPLREEIFAGVAREAVLVAGSTWPEDEAILIEVADRLRARLRFVVVPHEPTASHLAELERQFRKRGLETVRYSQATSWSESQVLLIDQIGILAELYLKGRYAFVGGSFRRTVHSVMEPLAAGCLTFVGPMHQNNREALEFKEIKLGRASDRDVHAVTETTGPTEFERILTGLLSSPNESWSTRLLQEIQRRAGASDRVVDWCLTRL